jgi:predicted dehydrogenase
MARTYDECQDMIAACREAGVPLYVAYYRRMLPRFLKVKELVDTGAVGEVRFVTVTLYQRLPEDGYDREHLPWRLIPEIAGAGYYLDLASHTLDYFDYLLGPVGQVQGYASNQGGAYDAEDVVTGSFVFGSGVHGTGTWCFTAFDKVDVNEVVGSEGLLRFSTFGTEPVVLETREGITEFPIDNPPHVQQPLIQTVVDALRGVGTCPSTGESAARTSWVMDEMLRGYRGKSG